MNFKSLMTNVYFSPLFWTQFLGAFNDNLYKNSLIILITFQSLAYTNYPPNLLIPLSAGVFILPFFLFSALAGQLADKYEKSTLIRMIKSLEIIIMLLTIIGFYFKSLEFLIAILFLMGCQSSLFGPLKFSILPQHLNEEGLMKGNALISMGTFLAILLGTILGGILATLEKDHSYYISFVIVGVAILGRLSSQRIPLAPSANNNLIINWNIFTASYSIFKIVFDNKLLLLTVLAISWFWFLGATILTILPIYIKNILHGEELVVTLLLSIFSIGIGIGTLLVGQTGVLKKSFKWFVPGIVGISFFSACLYWNSLYIDTHYSSTVLNTWISMFESLWNLSILISILGLGISAGFYIVPLYVVMQEYSDIKTRSRIIAGNNITNAFFMVCSALMILLLLNSQVSIESFFLLMSISNLFVVGILYLFYKKLKLLDNILNGNINTKLIGRQGV